MTGRYGDQIPWGVSRGAVSRSCLRPKHRGIETRRQEATQTAIEAAKIYREKGNLEGLQGELLVMVGVIRCKSSHLLHITNCQLR